MTPLFLDTKIVSSDMHIVKNESNFMIKMKRSKFSVTIPYEVTPEISYLSGAIAGDGNITLTERIITKYPRVKVRLFNSSKSYLSKINRLFMNVFGVKGVMYKKKNQACFVLEINNKIVWLYFVNVIGLKPKRKEYLEVPKLTENENLFKYFIAGLFDTDGFFSDRDRVFGIMMTGKNANFLERIKNLSKKFYDLDFNGIRFSTLIVEKKAFLRAQMTLKKRCVELFKRIIPLAHPKYDKFNN